MISNQKTNKRVILDCLARSRSIEISLEIKNDPSYLDPLEVLDLALPHSERCEKLLLSTKRCSAYARNILSGIEERLKRASFPQLREFGAHFFDNSSMEDVAGIIVVAILNCSFVHLTPLSYGKPMHRWSCVFGIKRLAASIP